MQYPVTLIISFYNKIDLLKLVLAALERQTFKNFEVIIADDGSRPEIVEEVKKTQSDYFFPIKHIWHEDNGWQKNKILNKSIVASEGEYLVFIDGDCIPHRRFIEEHFESRKENQTVSGRRVTLTEKISKKITIEKINNGYLEKFIFLPLFIETFLKNKKTHYKNLLRIRNKSIRKFLLKDKINGFWGCNFSVWKKDLMNVNGFDERFVYPGVGEDTDLDNRLRNNGVLPISKKHLVTQYHFYHVHFNLKHEPNFKLRDENIKNNVTFTPYGIIKSNEE